MRRIAVFLWVLCQVTILIPFPMLGQVSWELQLLGTPGYTRAVQVWSSEDAWVIGGDGGLYRTTDGGISWQRVDTIGLDGWLVYDLAIADESVLLATADSTEASAILRSQDSGVTWQVAFRLDGRYAFINGVRMTGPTHGVAIADPVDSAWVVLLTDDGGLTWRHALAEPPQAAGPIYPEVGWEHSIAALPSGHIWFGTDNSRVYRSTDGGTTWSYAAIGSFDVYGLFFTSDSVGVAACGAGLFHTNDGGGTWVRSSPTPTCFDVTGVGDHFWAIAHERIFQSTDAGATWDTAYTGPASLEQIHAVVDAGTITGWANGENASMVKFTLTATTAEEGRSMPHALVLNQNYPNPFNPSTTIRYGLPSRSHVTLTVFNTLGEQVTTLVQGEQEAGYYEAVFDASTLASGVYVYRLQAGDFVRSRKLTLMK